MKTILVTGSNGLLGQKIIYGLLARGKGIRIVSTSRGPNRMKVRDGYDYVEMRGRVEIDRDPVRGLEVISDLARRYHGDPGKVAREIEKFSHETRVTFVLRPDRIFERFAR